MTVSIRPFALLLALLVGARGACAQETAPFTLDVATLEAMAKVALPAVEKECGCDLNVRIRIATAAEVREALLQDSLPLLRAQLGNEEAAKAQAEGFAASMGDAMIAKYWFHHAEVLVNPAALELIATAAAVPELRSRDAALSILVHELVHAADDERYDLSRWIDRVADFARIEAANCVIEGHAQFVTRRICKAHGWSDGFAAFTRAISSPPRDVGGAEPAIALISRMMAARVSAWYVQGEAFFDVIAAERGAESGAENGAEPAADFVKRLFTGPPPTLEQIYEPRWFLHPELAPKTSFDVKQVLDTVAKRWSPDTWTTMQVEVPRPQFEIALELAPEAARKSALATVRTTRVLLASPVPPDGRQITLTVIELTTPPDALAFLELEEVVGRKKDEAMKEGTIRITDAAYTPLPPGGRRGFVMKKHVAIGEMKIEATTLVVIEERLLVEISYLMEPATDDALMELANALFAAAHADKR